MNRIVSLLLLLCLASAVNSQTIKKAQSYLDAKQLDKAKTEAHRLELDKERLQVEKRGQTTPARVERLAREKLQMVQAKPGITTYVTYSHAPVAEVAASASAPLSTGSGVTR